MATFTAAKEKTRSGKATHKNATYNTHASMKRVIDYIYNEKKGSPELMKGFNVNPKTAYEEMMLNKMYFGKDEEDGKRRMVVHFIQSFNPGEVEAKVASEIADKMLKHKIFEGFKVAYATHTDKPHIHTHFVIDTVNQETGIMWQLSKDQLQELKDYSDELCREYGLSVIQKTEQKKAYKPRSQMEAEGAGRSWVKETKLAVENCAAVSRSKEEFIEKLNSLGYKVVWDANKKHITFERGGHKIRGKTLSGDKLVENSPFSKEALEKRFSINEQVASKDHQNNEVENVVTNAMDGINTLIRVAARESKNNDYPFQSMENKTDSLLAKKEKMKELEKGQGYDWEV